MPTEQQRERGNDAKRTGSGQPDGGPGRARGGGLWNMPPRRTWLWLGLILLANVLLGRFLTPAPDTPTTIPYTLFKQEVAKGNVHAIYSRGETLTGRFKAPITYPPAGETATAPKNPPPAPGGRGAPPPETPKPVSSFTTTLPSFVGPGLEAFLIDHGVEISAKPIDEGGSAWTTLLLSFGPGVLFIAFVSLLWEAKRRLPMTWRAAAAAMALAVIPFGTFFLYRVVPAGREKS